MWYRLAKQGSIWDRIHPDAEKIFDELLNQSIVNTYKKQTLDIDKFNQLFQQSILKDIVTKFIIENSSMEIGGAFYKTYKEEVKKKFLFFYIKKLQDIKNVIKLNKKETNIIRIKGILKHEFTHAISEYILPNIQNELYVVPGYLRKKDLGNTIEETNKYIKYWKLVDNIDKLFYFKNYLAKNHFDYLELLWPYDFSTLNKNKLNEYSQTLLDLFQKFEEESTTKHKNPKKNYPFDKLEYKANPRELIILREINNLDFRNIFFESIYGSEKLDYLRKEEWDNLTTEEKNKYEFDFKNVLKQLNKRAQSLRNEVDLYYANPDETRSFINEMREYFSTKNLMDFYQLYFKTKNKTKEEFLNYIKNMFNELVDWKKNYEYDFSNEYENFLGFKFFNKITFKKYDQQYKRQLAKFFTTTYNQLKEQLSNTEPNIQQNSKDIEQTPTEE